MTRRRAIAVAATALASVGLALTAILVIRGSGPGVAVSRATDARSGVRAVSELTVTFDERRLVTSVAGVSAGPVRVRQLNRGSADHDLLIVRTDRRADDLPTGLSGVRPDLAGDVVVGRVQSHHSGGTHGSGPHAGHDHLRAGERRVRSVVLEPGRYILICPLPGHYEAGQYATLVAERR